MNCLNPEEENQRAITGSIRFQVDEDDDVFQDDNDIKNLFDKHYDRNFLFEIEPKNMLISPESQQFSAEICLSTKDIDFLSKKKEKLRVGVDLICLIDISGSMSGEKIQIVKETLETLLDVSFVTEKVRLQLITFDDQAEKLTPFKQLNPENKQQMKKIIESIQIGGDTNIGEGTNLAIQQLKKRKQKSEVTAILILSDGQDGRAVSALQEQLQGMDEDLTIHTLGYGNDHDECMMKALCNLGKGKFYYVQNYDFLGDVFGNFISGLISVAGKKIQIEAVCSPPPPFQDIKITQTYGDCWTTGENERIFKINKPYIQSAESCKFKFDIALPKFDAQLNLKKQKTKVKIMEAKLKIYHPKYDAFFQKTAELIITFCKNQEQLNTQGNFIVSKVDLTSQVENQQNSFQKAFQAEFKLIKNEKAQNNQMLEQAKQEEPLLEREPCCLCQVQ